MRISRWEGQLRFHDKANVVLKIKEYRNNNQPEQAYFVDWRVGDRLKENLMNQWDYIGPHTIPLNPKW